MITVIFAIMWYSFYLASKEWKKGTVRYIKKVRYNLDWNAVYNTAHYNPRLHAYQIVLRWVLVSSILLVVFLIMWIL